MRAITVTVLGLLFCRGALASESTPMWTDDPGRNRYSTAANLPSISQETLRWEVKTGGQYNFGIPALVRDGQVVLGSTTGAVDKLIGAIPGSNGSLLCYALQTGALLWATPVEAQGYGLCSSPLEEKGRIYVQGGGVWCFDAKGMADGNAGPFTDEVKLFNSRSTLGDQDADRIWSFNIKKALGFGTQTPDAHHGHAGTPLIVGDQIWVPTSYSHPDGKMNIHTKTQKFVQQIGGIENWNGPDPVPVVWQPNLLVLDKHTGALLAQDTLRISEIYHGSWSSLSQVTVDGRDLVLWGDGYGVLHAFAVPTPVDGQVVSLEEVWSYDVNPREHRFDENGNKRWFPYIPWLKGKEYTPEKPWGPMSAISPNYLIAAPVVWQGKVYAVSGRDYNYDLKAGGPGAGPGALHCIDPKGRGDISESGRVWMRTDLGRCASVGAIDPQGRLFIADNRGFAYCYDARTGEQRWALQLDEKDSKDFYCAPLVADGKLYVGTSAKILHVLRASDQPERLESMKLDSEILAPTAVDGALIVPTTRSLYCFATTK